MIPSNPLLTITYTPRYNGCHRIFFKTSEVDYCLYLDQSPSVVGTPKTVDFSISEYSDCIVTMPIPVGCETSITVSGYIQPCCSDINSNQNKVFFNVTYPMDECNSYAIQCLDPVDCGKFTVPNCYGEDDGTEYELRYGFPFQEVIRVCSGGDGPVGPGYLIQFGAPSCCICKLYNIVVDTDIDVYYTNCNQTIDIVTVQAGALGVTVCAVEESVWPVNKADHAFILSITETGDCIASE